MTATGRRHPLYVLFLLLMALLCVIGVALVIYGSLNNGISLPRLPGLAPKIAQVPHG